MKRPGNTVQVNVSIPRTLKATLLKYAEKEDRSLSNLIAVILKENIENRTSEK